MNTSNTRIAQLKDMIALEEKRAALQSQLGAIDGKLSQLQNALYGQPVKSSMPSIAVANKSAVKIARKQRGTLRDQILETLQAAGAKGVTVKDLAPRLAIKTTHLHSWFSANMKKIAAIKKIGPSHYALSGPVPAPAAKEAKPAKVSKVKAPKAVKVKAPKAAKVKPAKVAKPAKASKRSGKLKDQILAQLKEAGNAGITIKDLSAKLNAKYRNVYIWFVTTGKRIAGIKRIAPATYRLEA